MTWIIFVFVVEFQKSNNNNNNERAQHLSDRHIAEKQTITVGFCPITRVGKNPTNRRTARQKQ